MSQPPAPSRQTRRRRNSSGLLTNGSIALLLVVGCVYAVWGTGPLKRAWTALGFGKTSASQSASKIKTGYGADPVDGATDGTSKPIVPPPPLPLAELDAEGSVEESERGLFFPEKRTRQNLKVSRTTSLDGGNSTSELDQRFERETPDSIDSRSNSVHTAEFEEPAPLNQPRPKFPRHKKIQFEVETIETDVEQPDAASVRQIGDGAENKTPSATVPKRSGVKAKPASSVPGGGPIKTPEIQALIEAGRDAEAYQLLAEAYMKYPSDRPRFQELLDNVAKRIYFSPQPQIIPPYEIEPGDQLRKIAGKYQLSWQYLSKLNQVDAKKIRAGKKLKVFQGPFSATVDLSEFELTVYLNGQYVKRYKVGTGKENSSPIGEFMVKEKLENPTYYGPEGNVLAPDDPKNPLGERWIDIGNSFGIHGTIEPESIGKSESAGCIRMKNEDVAEVYDLLTVGSMVIIQR